MRKTKEYSGIYIKKYKDYIYTVKRIKNTNNGHPNFEVVLYNNVNKRFEILGDIYHVSTYDDIYKYIEKYIDVIISK